MIQRELQNPLAKLILEGRVKDGDTVRVGVGAKGLTIGTAGGETLRATARKSA